MTFLELARRAAIECGVATSSSIATALPTTVGRTGSVGRIVNWINDSWNDLQIQQDDWEWMRSSVLVGFGVSFVTVAGQTRYPFGIGAGTIGITEDAVGKWDLTTFRAATTATGYQDELELAGVSFDTWRQSYMRGAQRDVQTRPIVITEGPDQALVLGPPPNGLYTITGDYFRAPLEMQMDSDVPVGLPKRFHMLIVYRTMMKYAGYESAPEVYERGNLEARRMGAALLAQRAPTIGFGGPLA